MLMPRTVGVPLSITTAIWPCAPEVCPVIVSSPSSSAGGDGGRAAPSGSAYTRTLTLASDRGPLVVRPTGGAEEGGGDCYSSSPLQVADKLSGIDVLHR